MIHGNLVKNFTLKEMMNSEAKDDIKLVITPDVAEHAQMMQELREWAVKTYPNIFATNGLLVSSWYRTPAFNKSVGGAGNSAHLDGRATDIRNVPQTLYKDFTIAWQVLCSIHKKVGGVELYPTFIHFDSHSDKFGFKGFRLVDNRR
jgi:uncharacterized protein YcbK (DUF882 family)